MKVIKAKSAGFCFGVKRAVDTVYEQVEENQNLPIYTYGPIIHNEEVVKDLEQKGVIVLRSEEELDTLERGTVIIRSHGVAKDVYPKLWSEGSFESTLILSPPGAGKTTLLRDVVRQVSNGNRYGPGLQTAVVDERSELGACFKGVPQCDLGMRTDVMDGCPKALGMVMMIRSMAPGAVAVDEIGDREDLEALRYVMKCGCRILATVHGSSPEDLKKKPVLAEMVREGMFSRYVALSRRLGPGTVEAVCDGELRLLAGKGCQNEESGAGSPETEGKAEASGA